MKKLATLFTDSYKELRQVRTLTVLAMFAAISIVLGYYTIQVGEYLKIGFSSISNQIVYYLFGPAVGGIFGAALDFLKYLVNNSGGQPYFPPLVLSPVLGGIIYGTLYYKRPLSLPRILAAELIVAVICNMMITTACLSAMGGKGFFELLPLRIMKNLIMWPINSTIFYTIAKTLEASGVFRMIRTPGYLGRRR